MNPAQLAQIEDTVLDVLRQRPEGEDPLTLVDALLGDGIAEIEVRRAIWRLIDRRQVLFTPQRKLRLPAVTAARDPCDCPEHGRSCCYLPRLGCDRDVAAEAIADAHHRNQTRDWRLTRDAIAIGKYAGVYPGVRREGDA